MKSFTFGMVFLHGLIAAVMVADLYQTFYDPVKQDDNPSIHRIAGGLEKKCELAHTRLYYFCEPQTVAGTPCCMDRPVGVRSWAV
jgi:hypothetical protein